MSRHSPSHLCCAAVQRQIDDAADVVTALMEDINESLFVPTAIADITGVSGKLIHCTSEARVPGPFCHAMGGLRPLKMLRRQSRTLLPCLAQEMLLTSRRSRLSAKQWRRG